MKTCQQIYFPSAEDSAQTPLLQQRITWPSAFIGLNL